jgi:hypothetical protein
MAAAYECRAWAWDPPTNYLAAASGSEDGGLLPPELQPKQDQPVADKWCAPYAYKMRPELGCGGGDKWTIEPVEPFPRRWDWFSGNIFCNGERRQQVLFALRCQFLHPLLGNPAAQCVVPLSVGSLATLHHKQPPAAGTLALPVCTIIS